MPDKIKVIVMRDTLFKGLIRVTCPNHRPFQRQAPWTHLCRNLDEAFGYIERHIYQLHPDWKAPK